MRKKIFIQGNYKQFFGTSIAKYSIERFFNDGEQIEVVQMNTDEHPLFQEARGKHYTMKTATGKMDRKYDSDDLQSFTFSRFMPPELMDYDGRALVIDPDVFALKDVRSIFDFDMKGAAIAATRRGSGSFKSSVMLLECNKLTHWKISEILERLMSGELDSKDLISLKNESVTELPPEWNSHDKIEENTIMLHCTRKLTQPWKTGLRVDFLVKKPMPKFLGIIPREWIHKALGRYNVPTHYQPHPDPVIEKFFIDLVQEAVDAGAVKAADIERNIHEGHIRPDLLSKLSLA